MSWCGCGAAALHYSSTISRHQAQMSWCGCGAAALHYSSTISRHQTQMSWCGCGAAALWIPVAMIRAFHWFTNRKRIPFPPCLAKRAQWYHIVYCVINGLCSVIRIAHSREACFGRQGFLLSSRSTPGKAAGYAAGQHSHAGIMRTRKAYKKESHRAKE